VTCIIESQSEGAMFWGRRFSDICWCCRDCDAETHTNYKATKDEHPDVDCESLKNDANGSYGTGPKDGFSSSAPIDEESCWECCNCPEQGLVGVDGITVATHLQCMIWLGSMTSWQFLVGNSCSTRVSRSNSASESSHSLEAESGQNRTAKLGRMSTYD
jgi:hypothetical protein